MTPPDDSPLNLDADAPAGSRHGEIVLEVPARTEFVSFVRVVVAAAAEVDSHIDADRIEDLRVAVSEATTNAIDAHASSGVTDRICIQCNMADDEVVVVVRDRGMGFEPADLPALPEADSPDRLLHEKGLGLYLLRMLADESEISSTASGTDVRIVVYSSKRGRKDSDR